jgi:hypothetical protein
MKKSCLPMKRVISWIVSTCHITIAKTTGHHDSFTHFSLDTKDFAKQCSLIYSDVHYVALCQKLLAVFIRWIPLFPTLCRSIHTKSMDTTVRNKRQACLGGLSTGPKVLTEKGKRLIVNTIVQYIDGFVRDWSTSF